MSDHYSHAAIYAGTAGASAVYLGSQLQHLELNDKDKPPWLKAFRKNPKAFACAATALTLLVLSGSDAVCALYRGFRERTHREMTDSKVTQDSPEVATTHPDKTAVSGNIYSKRPVSVYTNLTYNSMLGVLN